MKLREAKKLLKLYPPIIELSIPESFVTRELMDEIKAEFRRSFKDNKVMLFLNPIENNIVEVPEDFNAVEFIEEWKRTGSYALRPFISNFDDHSFVKIHTVLNGVDPYKRTVKRINDLIKTKFTENATSKEE